MKMLTSTLRAAARLLCGPKHPSKVRWSGWKTMARITAEDGAVEQQPEKGDRDREQEQEGLLFELGLHRHRAPGGAECASASGCAPLAAGWQGIDHAAGL